MVLNESTPLNPQRTADLQRFMTNLMSGENLQRVGSVASERAAELQRSVQEGDFSIRLLALLAGLSLVLSALLGFLGTFVTFHWTSAILEFYALVLGLLMIVLESKQLSLPDAFLQQVFVNARFLQFVWGRGILYIVGGSLQLAQGNVPDYLVGGFVMFVGGLYVFVGHKTAASLRNLKGSLVSEQTLRTQFHECDVENSGTLSMAEFKTMVESMGTTLSTREAEAAFMHLNRQDNGELSYEDFAYWWKNYDNPQNAWAQRIL